MEPIRVNQRRQIIHHVCRNFRPRRSTWVTLGLMVAALMSISLRTRSGGTRNNLAVLQDGDDQNVVSVQDFEQHTKALFASHQPKKEKSASLDFERAIVKAYTGAKSGGLRTAPPKRNKFVLEEWTKQTKGGLNDTDRVLLAEIYYVADSVFEFGLGESTFIADHVGVPRYAGVDSDPIWINASRSNVSQRFKFYLADIGLGHSVRGFQKEKLPKSPFVYQVAPLHSELEAFDVYLVDGRYRLPCLLLSFLHASARGANPQDTTVVLHDCHRLPYHHADKLFEIYDPPDSKFCVYKRKPQTTNAALFQMWSKYMEKQT